MFECQGCKTEADKLSSNDLCFDCELTNVKNFYQKEVPAIGKEKLKCEEESLDCNQNISTPKKGFWKCRKCKEGCLSLNHRHLCNECEDKQLKKEKCSSVCDNKRKYECKKCDKKVCVIHYNEKEHLCDICFENDLDIIKQQNHKRNCKRELKKDLDPLEKEFKHHPIKAALWSRFYKIVDHEKADEYFLSFICILCLIFSVCNGVLYFSK